MTNRTLTFREAINEALRLEMRRDPTVVILGEDVAGGAALPHVEGEGEEAWGGVLGVTAGLAKEFGRDRVLDTPISESAFLGAAVREAANVAESAGDVDTADLFTEVSRTVDKDAWFIGANAEAA